MRHHSFKATKRKRTKRLPRGIKAPRTREEHDNYAGPGRKAALTKRGRR